MRKASGLLAAITLAVIMQACWSGNTAVYTGPPARTTSLDSARAPSEVKLEAPPDSLDVSFSVPGDSACPVVVEVYNMGKKLLRVLVDSTYSPGTYKIRWEAEDSTGVHLPYTVYYYQFDICDKVHTKSFDYRKKLR